MLLKGHDIHFSYGEETIFSGFNFELKPGERVVLKGESGSGKSTLFRLILGFELPASGEILLNGDPIRKDVLKTFRTQTAWLPQDLNIGSGTAGDVMEFPFRFKQSRNGRPAPQAVRHLVGDLGLHEDIVQKPFDALSTGQRQRIGIALCILLDKPVMLLDEPTSALDEASKKKAIHYLFDDKQRTILSTSHDPFWIDHCTRVIDLAKQT